MSYNKTITGTEILGTAATGCLGCGCFLSVVALFTLLGTYTLYWGWNLGIVPAFHAHHITLWTSFWLSIVGGLVSGLISRGLNGKSS